MALFSLLITLVYYAHIALAHTIKAPWRSVPGGREIKINTGYVCGTEGGVAKSSVSSLIHKQGTESTDEVVNTISILPDSQNEQDIKRWIAVEISNGRRLFKCDTGTVKDFTDLIENPPLPTIRIHRISPPDVSSSLATIRAPLEAGGRKIEINDGSVCGTKDLLAKTSVSSWKEVGGEDKISETLLISGRSEEEIKVWIENQIRNGRRLFKCDDFPLKDLTDTIENPSNPSWHILSHQARKHIATLHNLGQNLREQSPPPQTKTSELSTNNAGHKEHYNMLQPVETDDFLSGETMWMWSGTGHKENYNMLQPVDTDDTMWMVMMIMMMMMIVMCCCVIALVSFGVVFIYRMQTAKKRTEVYDIEQQMQ
eukprot:655154_1